MKKLLKKLIALFSVISFSFVTMGSVNLTDSFATETSVLLGDANGNGYVTISDSVFINQYLLGAVAATSYQVTCMDVNQDCVIDKTDSNILVYMDAYNISPTTTTKELYSIPDLSGRYYYRHDCSSNNLASKTQYYLSAPTVSMADESFEVEQRIAAEYRDYENLNVVRIATDSGYGSGFIVGNHIIATAAHVVYNHSNSTFANNVKVEVYNQNGQVNSTNLLCSSYAKTLHIPKSYATSTGGYQDNYDYALIYVDDDLSSYGVWSMGVVTTEFMDSGAFLTTSGYRYYNNIYARYYSSGAVVHYNELLEPHNLIDYRMYSNGTAYPGKSGGAVYYTSSFNNNMIKAITGVVTGTSDIQNGGPTWSVRMTPTLLRFYLQNSANLLEPT